MARVVVSSASPLFASGLASALAGVDGWQVLIQPGLDGADVWVTDRLDAAAMLPAGLPLVVLDHEPADPGWRQPGRAVARLSPTAAPAQLRAAVAAVLAGLSVHDAAHAGSAPAGAPLAADHEPLTPRELEVFELLGKGLSNRDIGGVLGISPHTAKFHVGQILAKVGAATRAEAVGAGLRMGVIGL